MTVPIRNVPTALEVLSFQLDDDDHLIYAVRA